MASINISTASQDLISKIRPWLGLPNDSEHESTSPHQPSMENNSITPTQTNNASSLKSHESSSPIYNVLSDVESTAEPQWRKTIRSVASMMSLHRTFKPMSLDGATPGEAPNTPRQATARTPIYSLTWSKSSGRMRRMARRRSFIHERKSTDELNTFARTSIRPPILQIEIPTHRLQSVERVDHQTVDLKDQTAIMMVEKLHGDDPFVHGPSTPQLTHDQNDQGSSYNGIISPTIPQADDDMGYLTDVENNGDPFSPFSASTITPSGQRLAADPRYNVDTSNIFQKTDTARIPSPLVSPSNQQNLQTSAMNSSIVRGHAPISSNSAAPSSIRSSIPTMGSRSEWEDRRRDRQNRHAEIVGNDLVTESDLSSNESLQLERSSSPRKGVPDSVAKLMREGMISPCPQKFQGALRYAVEAIERRTAGQINTVSESVILRTPGDKQKVNNLPEDMAASDAARRMEASYSVALSDQNASQSAFSSKQPSRASLVEPLTAINDDATNDRDYTKSDRMLVPSSLLESLDPQTSAKQRALLAPGFVSGSPLRRRYKTTSPIRAKAEAKVVPPLSQLGVGKVVFKRLVVQQDKHHTSNDEVVTAEQDLLDHVPTLPRPHDFRVQHFSPPKTTLTDEGLCGTVHPPPSQGPFPDHNDNHRASKRSAVLADKGSRRTYASDDKENLDFGASDGAVLGKSRSDESEGLLRRLEKREARAMMRLVYDLEALPLED